MNKKIIWKKWKSPYEKLQENFQKEQDDDYEEIWKDSYQKDDDDNHSPMMQTPMGFVPINLYNSPTKEFNLWMMHCDFYITQEIKDIINNEVKGIESINIISPYRILIGIGMAFNEKKVKLNIENELNKDE